MFESLKLLMTVVIFGWLCYVSGVESGAIHPPMPLSGEGGADDEVETAAAVRLPPGVARDPDSLRQYIRKLNQYFTVVSRPRFHMAADKPLIELFVKTAPSDREDKGPCPISQQWFMAFYILVENEMINLRVTPVNTEILDNQPPNYTRLEVGRRIPVAWVESGFDPQGRDISGLVADGSDELEKLMDMWHCPALTLGKDNPLVAQAEAAFANLYKNLNNLLKNDNEKPLLNDLVKLEAYLGQQYQNHGGRYLLGDQLTYADCQLMPKLQHLRVAAKAFKDFEIPYGECPHVWRYLNNMYASGAFQYSCPTDRDILLHYFDKVQPPPRHIKPSLMEPFRTDSVPREVIANNNYPPQAVSINGDDLN